MKKSRLVFNLFFTMMKIGLFTFGGGYAMIALLENEFVAKKKWLTKEEFLDMLAIAESTPGPIAINSATYIGCKTVGFFGALAATVGVCIPSFVILYAISLFFDAFLSLTIVEYAFMGIQACVIYLILSAGIKMLKGIKKNVLNVATVAIVVACMILFSLFSIKFSTIFYILIFGALGVCIYLFSLLCGRKEESK